MSRVVDRKNNTVCRGDSKPESRDPVSPSNGKEALAEEAESEEVEGVSRWPSVVPQGEGPGGKEVGGKGDVPLLPGRGDTTRPGTTMRIGSGGSRKRMPITSI